MEVAAILIIGLVTVGFVGWPLLRPAIDETTESTLDTRRRELLALKTQILSEIKDLEMSHDIGKLSTGDYSPMASAAKKRAAAILRELDDVDEQLGYAHADKRRRKPKKASSRAKADARVASATKSVKHCPTCEANIAGDDAFCRKCGAAL